MHANVVRQTSALEQELRKQGVLTAEWEALRVTNHFIHSMFLPGPQSNINVNIEQSALPYSTCSTYAAGKYLEGLAFLTLQ